MKLLIVTPLAPYPPTSGGRLRVWEEVRHLSRRHDVTVVFFTEPDDPPSSLDGMCARSFAVPRSRLRTRANLALRRGVPWPLRGFGTAEMQRAIQAVRPHSFDAVIVDHLHMTLYRDLFPASAVLQEHNIESQLARQYAQRSPVVLPGPNHRRGVLRGVVALARRARSIGAAPLVKRARWSMVAARMERYENRIWPTFPLRIAVSVADKAEIDRRCPTGQTVVVENGADLSAPVLRQELGARSILFVGALDYAPNVDAAVYLVRTIMPAVWARSSNVQVIIAGRGPGPLTALTNDPRVRVVADPADMRAVAAQASVSVVPLRFGTGTRLKILEALAWGLPIVSTRLGCEGLALTDEEHLVVRDDPEAFAEAIVGLLSNPKRWRQFNAAGRAIVEQRYGWEPLVQRLETALHQLVDGAAPASAPERSHNALITSEKGIGGP